MKTVWSPFRPRLLETWQHYSAADLGRDIGAGLTVAIVALPLAMAFAIASGLQPQAGLFTAIIAGFLISALGGSRVQIGGPAGAFIVVVYGIVERYGLANLILATAMSGLLLFALGFFRLGGLIRFVPVAVVVGFTNGIAVLIMVSQVRDFLGLAQRMPADFFGMLSILGQQIHTLQWPALALGSCTLGLLIIWNRLTPRLGSSRKRLVAALPGSMVALIAATGISWGLSLPTETIGSRFGGIPTALPSLQWPSFSWESARFLIMPTITLALLGAIESLLCARIADKLSGDRHNPNQELMAQGIANFATPFFGGMPATGTVARTVTNIQSGARSPVAGMVHALTLLVIVLAAAPLAAHIPLAALAGILVFVGWNMGDWRAFARLRLFPMPYRVTLLSVFLLTVIFDLTVAVQIGLLVACLTLVYRMSSLSRSEAVTPQNHPLLEGQNARIQVWRLHGALFFGAVKLIEDIERQQVSPQLVLDLKNVIYLDASGIDALDTLVQSCQSKNIRLIVCGLAHQPLEMARRTGLLQQVQQSLVPDLQAGIELALGHEPDAPPGSPKGQP